MMFGIAVLMWICWKVPFGRFIKTRRIENRCSRTWIFHTVLYCWKGSVYCLLQKVCIDFGQLCPCLRSWKCNNIHSNQLQTVVRKNSFKNWCIIGARQWSFQSCLSFCSGVGRGPITLVALDLTVQGNTPLHSTPPIWTCSNFTLWRTCGWQEAFRVLLERFHVFIVFAL